MAGSTKRKPRILITNDDGIEANGIYALALELRKIGDIIVVAPDRQQSAVGHALTVNAPVRVTPFHRNGVLFGYAVTGTPADCVKLAVRKLLDHPPDLIISGINHGANTAVNILYSGTVSAATEGMLFGIPSAAISVDTLDEQFDCSCAAYFARIIANFLLTHPLPAGTFLNVNVPALPMEQIKGIRFTRQGTAYWIDDYEELTDPHGQKLFWIKGKYIVPEDDPPDTDDAALQAGYVSVTPIRYQLTDEDLLKTLQEIELLPSLKTSQLNRHNEH